MKKNIKKYFALILALCMIIAAVPVSAASVSPAAKIIRGTTTLYLEDKNIVLKSNAKNSNTQWSTQDSNVAYVRKGSRGGSVMVYAKAAGTTHIYAITEEKNTKKIEDFTIIVRKKPKIKLSCTSKTLKTGNTFTITLSNIDKPGSYSIINDSIAKVMSSASSTNSTTRLGTCSVKIKALKKGTATWVFVTGGKKYSCKIIVK